MEGLLVKSRKKIKHTKTGGIFKRLDLSLPITTGIRTRMAKVIKTQTRVLVATSTKAK